MICQSLQKQAEIQFGKTDFDMNALVYPKYCFHVGDPVENGKLKNFFEKNEIGNRLNKLKARQLLLWFYILVVLAHAFLLIYLIFFMIFR